VIEERRNMLFPFRAVRAGPPVETRFGFPGQPDFARVLSKEIHLLEAFGDSKAPRPVSHNHHVVGALHDRFCQPRNIFDPADGGHAARAARRAVHHAGVQFNFTFLVGKAAVAYAVIVGIVFHDSHSGDSRVQRIATALQDLHALVESVQPVGRRNNERTRPRSWRWVEESYIGATSIGRFQCSAKDSPRAGECAPRQRCQKKLASCPAIHDHPPKRDANRSGWHSMRIEVEKKLRVRRGNRLQSEPPSGRKYCVPLTGSCRRRRSCCKSSFFSTKSISEVSITSRSAPS